MATSRFELRVRDIVNFTHAARAEGPEDFARVEFGAGEEGHKQDSAKFSRSRDGYGMCSAYPEVGPAASSLRRNFRMVYPGVGRGSIYTAASPVV